jgi:hypothetical protein
LDKIKNKNILCKVAHKNIKRNKYFFISKNKFNIYIKYLNYKWMRPSLVPDPWQMSLHAGLQSQAQSCHLFLKQNPISIKKTTRYLPYFKMRLAFSDSGHRGGWKIKLSDFFPLKTHFPPIFHSKHLNNLVKPIFKLQKRKQLVQNQESTWKPISSWSHIWIF